MVGPFFKISDNVIKVKTLSMNNLRHIENCPHGYIYNRTLAHVHETIHLTRAEPSCDESIWEPRTLCPNVPYYLIQHVCVYLTLISYLPPRPTSSAILDQ